MNKNRKLLGHTNGDPLKGAKLRQLGYATGIHALPDFIKEKIDALLLAGETPASVIKLINSKYPKLQLPSQTAIYNYKKRYLKQPEQIDKQTLDVNEVLVEHIKRFLAFDVPTVRHQWIKSLTDESKNSYQTGKQYFEAVKIMSDFIQKLNVGLDMGNQVKEPDSIAGILDNESPKETLARIVKENGKQLGILFGKKVTISDL